VISETEAPKDIITTSYGWIQRPLTEFAPSLATPIGIGGILLFYGMLAALAYVLHRKQIYIKV
jgi:hypothetical protein